jgi:hypothetical protein
MFTRRLPTNQSDSNYYAFVIDGKLAGVVGFILRPWWCGSDYTAQLALGETVPTLRRLSKLMLMCVTSKQFRNILVNKYRGTVWPMTGVRTTCLSVYPSVNTNRGIFKLVTKEQLKNGSYRLVYATDWHDWTMQEALIKWLHQN